jgi:hypothetical protein
MQVVIPTAHWSNCGGCRWCDPDWGRDTGPAWLESKEQDEPAPPPDPEWVRRARAKLLVAKDMSNAS